MEVRDRALKYVLNIDSVAGQNGHDGCYHAACVLAEGFDLSEDDTRACLRQWNQVNACPPWSDKELEHKVRQALKAAGESAKRGYLLNARENGVTYRVKRADGAVVTIPSNSPPTAAPTDKAGTLTEFLEHCFLPGEHIAIVKSVWDEDSQRARPEHSGIVLSREQWIAKAASAGGTLERWFSPKEDSYGAYIRINPMRPGGKEERDVTAYRYACLEFDNIDVIEQWRQLQASGAPIRAVVHSGGKSLHAWVTVGAKDRTEFNARAEQLIKVFPGCDHKVVKSINRWSRLPDIWRQGKRQTWLARSLGAKDWNAWVQTPAAAEVESLSLGELAAFDTKNDPDCRLGERWLCRGSSCLWVGPSGIGKSSLTMQAALTWAMQRPFVGIVPTRALKSLIVQAENDKGDMAEEIQGVAQGLGLSAEDLRNLEQMVQIRRVADKVGVAFCDWLRNEIKRFQPDMVWIDPLLAYFGGDINSQKDCAQFLRVMLNVIAEESGAIINLIHHTAKPSKDKSAFKNWTASDYAYIGSGSSELTNWARAIVYLKPAKENFLLLLPKRGKRAGVKNVAGEIIDTKKGLALKHGTTGIWWDYADEPAPEPPPKPKYRVKQPAAGLEERFKAAAEKHSGNMDAIMDALNLTKSQYYELRRELDKAPTTPEEDDF